MDTTTTTTPPTPSAPPLGLLLVESIDSSPAFNMVKSGRIKFTCVAASSRYLALGANSGSVYLFDIIGTGLRHRHLIAASADGANSEVTSLRFGHNDNLLALGTAKGVLLVFELNLDSHKDKAKVLLKSLTEHKDKTVTALQWSQTDDRLFSGDDGGMLYTTQLGDTLISLFRKPEFIHKADSKIVQLDMVDDKLIASSLSKVVLLNTSRQTVLQVGKKTRQGPYGACFTSSQEMLSARPGLRLWSADLSGNVLATLNFQSVLAAHSPSVITSILNLDADPSAIVQNDINESTPAEQAEANINFTLLHQVHPRLVLSYNDSSLFLIDTIAVDLHAWYDRVKDIRSVATISNQIFVLCEGAKRLLCLSTLVESRLWPRAVAFCVKYTQQLLDHLDLPASAALLSTISSLAAHVKTLSSTDVQQEAALSFIEEVVKRARIELEPVAKTAPEQVEPQQPINISPPSSINKPQQAIEVVPEATATPEPTIENTDTSNHISTPTSQPISPADPQIIESLKDGVDGDVVDEPLTTTTTTAAVATTTAVVATATTTAVMDDELIAPAANSFKETTLTSSLKEDDNDAAVSTAVVALEDGGPAVDAVAAIKKKKKRAAPRRVVDIEASSGTSLFQPGSPTQPISISPNPAKPFVLNRSDSSSSSKSQPSSTQTQKRTSRSSSTDNLSTSPISGPSSPTIPPINEAPRTKHLVSNLSLGASALEDQQTAESEVTEAVAEPQPAVPAVETVPKPNIVPSNPPAPIQTPMPQKSTIGASGSTAAWLTSGAPLGFLDDLKTRTIDSLSKFKPKDSLQSIIPFSIDSLTESSVTPPAVVLATATVATAPPPAASTQPTPAPAVAAPATTTTTPSAPTIATGAQLQQLAVLSEQAFILVTQQQNNLNGFHISTVRALEPWLLFFQRYIWRNRASEPLTSELNKRKANIRLLLTACVELGVLGDLNLLRQPQQQKPQQQQQDQLPQQSATEPTDANIALFITEFFEYIDVNRVAELCNRRHLSQSLTALFQAEDSNAAQADETRLALQSYFNYGDNDRIFELLGQPSTVRNNFTLILRYLSRIISLEASLTTIGDFLVHLYPFIQPRNVLEALQLSLEDIPTQAPLSPEWTKFAEYLNRLVLLSIQPSVSSATNALEPVRSSTTLISLCLRLNLIAGSCTIDQSLLLTPQKSPQVDAHKAPWQNAEWIDEILAHCTAQHDLLTLVHEYAYFKGELFLLLHFNRQKEAITLVLALDDPHLLETVLQDCQDVSIWEHLVEQYTLIHALSSNTDLVQSSPRISINWLVEQLTTWLEPEQAIAVLFANAAFSERIDLSVYETFLRRSQASHCRSQVVHSMLEGVDAYLWLRRPQVMPASLRHLRDQETAMGVDCVTALPYLTTTKSDGESASSAELTFDYTQMIWPKYYEESTEHWGVSSRLGVQLVCACCTLSLAESMGSSSMVSFFPCGHAFHNLCLPEDACVLCFHNKMGKLRNLHASSKVNHELPFGTPSMFLSSATTALRNARLYSGR